MDRRLRTPAIKGLNVRIQAFLQILRMDPLRKNKELEPELAREEMDKLAQKRCLVQPPIHQVLRCEDEAVGIVMRKYRVEQAAGPVVDRAVIKTQAKCPHLLIPENLRVKRVDVSQAEDDGGDDSSVGYHKFPHLPNPITFFMGLNPSSSKWFTFING